jgi:integrase/recombinase XerC
MSIETFLAAQAEKERSANTLKAYAADLSLFAKWFQITNGQPLGDTITAIDVKDYKAALIFDKAKPATINRRLTTLINFAHFHGNEIEVKKVDEQKLAPRSLTRQELAAFLREAERRVQVWRDDQANRVKAQYNLAGINFLVNTGLRISEFCNIEAGDVEITERKGWLIVRKGKGGKFRKVPLNAEARKAYKQLEPIPIRIKPRQWQTIVAGIGLKAGLNVTPHMLRHTFGKSLIDKGSQLQEVGDLLGHKSLNTTRDYVTPSEADLEQVVEKLE